MNIIMMMYSICVIDLHSINVIAPLWNPLKNRFNLIVGEKKDI